MEEEKRSFEKTDDCLFFNICEKCGKKYYHNRTYHKSSEKLLCPNCCLEKVSDHNIKVKSKDGKQFILHENGTYTKIEDFKIGDNFKCIKQQWTSEGVIEIGDTFTIENITFCYWIKCLNKQKKGKDWVMGHNIKDFNEDDKHFKKI